MGRHNAVDKVVGWALLNGRLPLAGCVLLDLLRRAKEIGIKGRSTMSKAELAKALRDH